MKYLERGKTWSMNGAIVYVMLLLLSAILPFVKIFCYDLKTSFYNTVILFLRAYLFKGINLKNEANLVSSEVLALIVCHSASVNWRRISRKNSSNLSMRLKSSQYFLFFLL